MEHRLWRESVFFIGQKKLKKCHIKNIQVTKYVLYYESKRYYRKQERLPPIRYVIANRMLLIFLVIEGKYKIGIQAEV